MRVIRAAVRAAFTDLKRSLILPTGALDETFNRANVGNGGISVTSGTLRLAGFVVLRAGVQYTSIAVDSVAAVVTPTNQWFCLVRVSDLAVLAKTADDGAAAWGANTTKSLAITGGPITVSQDTLCWVGVLQAAATPATLGGTTLATAAVTRAPMHAGNANAALTNPASLGANVSAPSAASGLVYATVS